MTSGTPFSSLLRLTRAAEGEVVNIEISSDRQVLEAKLQFYIGCVLLCI